ncbi:MAG: hypothetical protein COU90_00165 [Candidatus Ryanbacteria bacterium CG10_big_fil_rev_8_21_14_0_10_43_42]|uniref:Teneurin-like YD-shell domain-containing protein n=1 Tax=Candidatus Ryanbacteria bacterium CG10_big_fil_rev_8_21_14_0_10_43_42 TaxID=1974864 RepID=A0A2M8KYB6_9BACT|nr:MAG: hypothetical protein COU90_00165 [Candidatus Ryanbacteria bacterium CG10_big_fil_rev_8_21_14_0_10_43_42]
MQLTARLLGDPTGDQECVLDEAGALVDGTDSSLAAGDYDAIQTTEIASNRLDITDISVGERTGDTRFTLNGTGLLWIKDAGDAEPTRMFLRISGDFDNTDPGLGNGQTARCRMDSAEAGGGNEPVLTVTWNVGNQAPTAPTSLQTESQTNPTDITDPTPEFSAIYNDPDSGDLAPWYRIQVSSSSIGDWAILDWDSGTTTMATTTEGNRSPELSYGGSALASSTIYYWRIRFSDDDGKEGAWSTATSTFSLAAAGVPGVATTTGGIQNFVYTYDNVGNITKIVDTSETDTEKTIQYVYDDLYRLTSASTTLATTTQSDYVRTYAYSSIGNITSKSDVGSYTYGETGYANPHAATDINGATQTYSNSGNLLSNGTWNFRWDYVGRMKKASSTSATASYGYDHTGQRVFLAENDLATTTYANSLYSISSATTTKHIFANGQLVATIEVVGTATTTNYVHTDHLSGSSVITDDNGDVVQVLDYYPFGALRVDNQDTNFNEKRKFTGYEYDDSTGLNYAGARYQNPAKGRFTSQDPASRDVPESFLADPQQLNMYAYGRNNPVNLVDPTGEYILFPKFRAGLDIRFNRENIKNAASRYPDVRADILAANIYEERRGALNVNFIDTYTDVYGGLLGIDTSIGLGQIRISTAQNAANAGYFDVDQLYDDTFSFGGNMPQRLKMIHLLNNNETNAIIGAAFLQQQIDKWKEFAPDVANDPELLGSIYNDSRNDPADGGFSNPFGERVAGSIDRVNELLE